MLENELQIKNIKDRIKKASNGNERLRLNVVYLHYKLHNLSQIADLLCLPYNTAKNYLNEFLNNDKSDNLPRGGSDEQSNELESHLQNKTYFKCHEIIAHIQELYNITYTKSGMKKWLKRHKFVYKKPIQYPAKLDQAKQKDFIEFYDKLKTDLPYTKTLSNLDFRDGF